MTVPAMQLYKEIFKPYCIFESIVEIKFYKNTSKLQHGMRLMYRKQFRTKLSVLLESTLSIVFHVKLERVNVFL